MYNIQWINLRLFNIVSVGNHDKSTHVTNMAPGVMNESKSLMRNFSYRLVKKSPILPSSPLKFLLDIYFPPKYASASLTFSSRLRLGSAGRVAMALVASAAE